MVRFIAWHTPNDTERGRQQIKKNSKTKMHLLLAEYYVVSGLGNYLPSRSLTLILFDYGENNEVNSNRIKKCNHIFARIAII